MEANPRLQVEHTVTEALCEVDLVHIQFGLAAGKNIAQLGLLDNGSDVPPPRGYAIQSRINMETLSGGTCCIICTVDI
jgi:pyruvate carboxylase